MRKALPYTLSDFVVDVAKTDRAAALAFFLLDNTGSVLGEWNGQMSVADQRKLFGFVVGRGRICIMGDGELVMHSVTVCFGTMTDCVFSPTWGDLCTKTYRDYPHLLRAA